MNPPILAVDGISKRYRLGAIGSTRIADELSSWIRRTRGSEKGRNGEFWALRDVTFSVEAGEVLGIIGRNGAGKSTLLKVLSRITRPTEGRITLHGRIASLLEVGTGFHPDLTGRENIFLNGAILGMRKKEIRRKLNEIVAFSEIDVFLDTPVKRYSSGMYVRLAFSIAAHLDPEILIVDEVLAVGDSQFQGKCLEKIRSLASGGRTVLFVSHSLSTVATLCSSGALLSAGRLVEKTTAALAIQRYISSAQTDSGRWTRPESDAPLPIVRLESGEIRRADGQVTREFNLEEPVTVVLRAHMAEAVRGLQFSMRVTNSEGIVVFTTCNTDEFGEFVPVPKGTLEYAIAMPAQLLLPGRYTLHVAAHIPEARLFDQIDNELNFVIHDTGSLAQRLRQPRLGTVNVILPWSETPLDG